MDPDTSTDQFCNCNHVRTVILVARGSRVSPPETTYGRRQWSTDLCGMDWCGTATLTTGTVSGWESQVGDPHQKIDQMEPYNGD